MIIVTVILAVWTCASPFFYYRIFKEEKPVELPRPKKKTRHKAEMPEDLQAKIDYLSNIETYYGAGSKQKDIKR